jgi:hypothetical protein
MPIDRDFPAAHSMDTIWWAVDGQGHVARISTGEAGSVPAELPEPSASDELYEQLAAAKVPFYCDDLFSQADGKLYLRDYRQAWDEVAEQAPEATGDVDYFFGFLLWFRDEAALAKVTTASAAAAPNVVQRIRRLFTPAAAALAESGWGVLRLPVEGKVAVWISTWEEGPKPTLADVRRLLASGDILRGWVYQRELEPERMGLFGYELETFDNWIAGPFERGGDPPRPLRLDDLPAGARGMLAPFELPLADFPRDRLLQPFEHGPAQCWGSHWISTTGRQFHNEESGPELPGIAPAASRPLSVSAGGGSTLQALTAAYLNGEPGADGVLNDFLEESGHEHLAMHDSPGRRLDEVLMKLLTPEARWHAEAGFVEHVLAQVPPPGESAIVARAALSAMRDWLARRVTKEQLQEAASAALQAWMPAAEQIDEEGAPPRDNGVAWAAWALARRWPLVAARTARTIQPGEFEWQAEFVLRLLADTGGARAPSPSGRGPG